MKRYTKQYEDYFVMCPSWLFWPIVAIVVLVVVAIFSFGCGISDAQRELSNDREHPERVAHRELDGSHKLRKLFPHEVLSSKGGLVGSGFFLFGIGGMDIHDSTEVKKVPSVTFAWQMRDGAYAITTFPLSKIRVEIADVRQPEVYFRWSKGDWWKANIHIDEVMQAEELMKFVDDATFKCREEDWPSEVHYPLNGGMPK